MLTNVTALKGLGNNNDEFHMFRSYLPSWDLDFEIKASNLASATHQAGIMMRESTHSNSKHVSVLIKGDGALVQAARSQNGGDTVFTEEPGVTGEGNTWLRLRKTLKLSCKWVKKGWWPFYECRSDFHIRSYYKKDNIDWTQFGGTQVLTMNAFNDNIFGIGVTSNDNSELAVLNVPEVKVTLGTQDQALLSSTLDEESCAPSARKIRLHLSSPVDDIEAFEFHVTFSGEALELLASDNDFNGSSAVERQMMELPGLKDNTSMGLELDLGKSFSVESVSIVGRECVESNDPDCLCPINGATLSLVGDSGEDIASIDIGEDACGKAKMEYVIDASPEFCASSIEDYAVVSQHAVFIFGLASRSKKIKVQTISSFLLLTACSCASWAKHSPSVWSETKEVGEASL